MLGTIHEGRVFTKKAAVKNSTGFRLPENFKPIALAKPSPAKSPVHDHDHDHRGSSCACATGHAFAAAIYPED